MATSSSPVLVQVPKLALVKFLGTISTPDAPGTYKTLYTGGANGSKIIGLWENNNDGSLTHNVTLAINRSGIIYGGVVFTTAVNDGWANGTPAKNLMTPTLWPGLPIDSDGNPYFFLQSGDILQATFATALTTNSFINLAAVVGDF